MPAQKDAITTVKCHPRMIILDFRFVPVANKHCLQTLKALEGLNRMIVAVGGIRMEAVDQVDMKVKLKRSMSGWRSFLRGGGCRTRMLIGCLEGSGDEYLERCVLIRVMGSDGSGESDEDI
jgi:hypothetical protein